MIPIVLIAATIGLLAGVYLALRGSPLVGCLLLLVVGYCLGHFFVNFDLGPLPLTLDRLLLGGLLVSYFVQRYHGLADPKPFCWIDGCMLAFAGWLVIRTFMHDWRAESPGAVAPLWLLVSGYLTPVLIYFLVRNSRWDSGQVMTAYRFLALFGIYLALTGLAEIAGQWWAVFPRYISDPALGIHFGRARGPLLQSQSLGIYLVLCLFAAWAWQRHAIRPIQVTLYAMVPVFALAIYFTYTRCVWLALILGGFVILCVSLQGRWRPLIVGGSLAGALLVGILSWNQIVGIEREAGAEAARESVTQRASFAYVSWQMFKDRPLLGFGFGQFPDAKRPYLSDRSTSNHLEAIRVQPHHNTFLSLLTETGLIGLCLYLCILGGWVWTGWKMWRDPTTNPWYRTQGVLVIGCVAAYFGPALFFDLAYSPNDHWLLFLIGGITTGIATQKAPQPGAMPQLNCGAAAPAALMQERRLHHNDCST